MMRIIQFFFLWCGRCRSKARSCNWYKQVKLIKHAAWNAVVPAVLENGGKAKKQPNNEKRGENKRRPANPPARFAFRQEKQRRSNTQTGPGPNTKQKQHKICHKTQGEFPTVSIQKKLAETEPNYVHPSAGLPVSDGKPRISEVNSIVSLRSKIDNSRTAGSHPWKPSILSTTIGWTLSTSWKALLWQSPLWRWWCVYLRWCGSDHCSGHRCELRRPRPCPLRFVQARAQNTFEWADPGHWSSQPVLSQQHFPW